MSNINKKELHDLFNSFRENKKEEIYNELYNKYEKLVFKIAYSLIKNNDSSEDIKQIVFSKIWEINKESLPFKSEASWLYTLTKNETINYIRKQENTINIEDIYNINDDNKELNEIIDIESFNKMISKLDKEEQEIISLKILSNLSFKEISKILNKPIGTIQWKYYKSISNLKILLSNLSMFIISAIIYVSRMFSRKDASIEDKVQNTENIDTNYREDKQDSLTEQLENSSLSNQVTQNVIIEDDNLNKNINNYNNVVDIGILSISGIFLFLTIIFSYFFIKHQQKLKKKVSK